MLLIRLKEYLTATGCEPKLPLERVRMSLTKPSARNIYREPTRTRWNSDLGWRGHYSQIPTRPFDTASWCCVSPKSWRNDGVAELRQSALPNCRGMHRTRGAMEIREIVNQISIYFCQPTAVSREIVADTSEGIGSGG